jgi:hypothetical protein
VNAIRCSLPLVGWDRTGTLSVSQPPLDSRDPSLGGAEMTLPAPPPPEKGTRIVFVGSTRDELLAVDVEENAPAVELSGRISQLTRDDGLPVWVNLANVLYVESVKVQNG